MKEKIIRFMQGRYGADQFGRFLSGLCFAFLILSLFSRYRIWYALALLVLIYQYFRIFSRNIPRRYAENQRYLAATAKVRTRFFKAKGELAQRKTHHIYRCPSCRQKIRIPRGHGKVEIRCPKCNAHFTKKS